MNENDQNPVEGEMTEEQKRAMEAGAEGAEGAAPEAPAEEEASQA